MGQPGSTLVNHLGITNTWGLPAVTRSSVFFSVHNQRLAEYVLRVYINSGIIHMFNIFSSNYWVRYVDTLSLPTISTFNTFSNFYSLSTIKNERLNLKNRYILSNNSTNTDIVLSKPLLTQSSVWYFLFTPMFGWNSKSSISPNWVGNSSWQTFVVLNSFTLLQLYRYLLLNNL